MSQRPLRVLAVNYEYPPIGGGAGHAHQQILRRWADDPRITVDLVTSGIERGIHEQRLGSNIRIVRVGITKASLHYWRKSEVLTWLRRAAGVYRGMRRSSDYDLAHAFFAFPSGWLPYRQRGDPPYIVSLRGSDVPGYNQRLGLDYRLLAGLFGRIWRNAAAVVANSEGLAQLARRFIPELHFDVIPNGIDTDRFHPSGQPWTGGPVRALTVCRLIGRKRLDLLIEAVALCRQRGIDVSLTIAGDGNLMDELKALATRLNVADHVRLPGRVEPDAMPGLYREHNLFVMASEHEGMSNAMLEAVASGLPMVTTRCEGVEELINGNGIVVDRATPDALAGGITTYANDPAAYAQAVQASKQQARRFDWSVTADEYLALYQRVVNGVTP